MHKDVVNKNQFSGRFPVVYVLLVVCLLSMAGGALAGQGAAVQTVRVVTPEWSGQTNRDGTGLFFNIVRVVYARAGIRMAFQFAPWKRCQAMLAAGRSDAMLCVWKSDADKRGFLTPKYPLYVEQTAVVFKKSSRIPWQGIHSLDYRRAVWLRGYNYDSHRLMQGIQLALMHEVDSYEEAWHQLNMDRFDFYIEALIDLDAFIRENEVDMGLYQKEVLWRTKAYVAFSDSDQSRQLIQAFDREMKPLFESGELAGIYKKWHQPFFPEHWETPASPVK